MPGLVAGSLILGGISAAAAQPTEAPGGQAEPQGQSQRKAPRQQGAEAEFLQRLQELEAQVARLKAEIARLQAELSGKDKSKTDATSNATAGEGQPPLSTDEQAASQEWDEPDVAKKQEGRDEEARRRLTALETQLRKLTAEAAKQEEESKNKTKFDFSGKYKAQINSRNNLNLDNPRQQWEFDNTTYFEHRYSLQIDAVYESLLTRLALDKGNFMFDWKEDSEGTLERWGQFQTVNSTLVRELFVQYTGPFMFRIGRQNWDVGQKLVLEGPVDGVRLQFPLGRLPWGQTTLSGGYIAVAGGWQSYTDFLASGGPPAGNREAVLSASNKLDAYYLDLDIRPSRSLGLKPYVLKVADRGGSGDADLNLDKDFMATTTPRDGGFQPLWTGISVSADLNVLKLDGEIVWLSGDYTNDRSVQANALLLQATRDFGKVGFLHDLSVGFQFGRGSGNGTDDSSTGTLRNFGGLFLCRERRKFGNIFSEDIRAGYFLWDSNLSNITYARLDTTLRPFKDLELTPSVTKIWTTEKVFEGRGPVSDWSRGTATSTSLTRDVGLEIDLNVTYHMLKNLDGFFSIGYFRPGAVYARPDGSDAEPAVEVILGTEVNF